MPSKNPKEKKEEKEGKYVRPTWDEYFINVMMMIGTRSTCDRGRSGCVIVHNKRILTTGYVGSPVGQPHCDEVGHEIHQVINDDDTVSRHCIRTIHAEQNALIQAARVGVSLQGATLYCKMTPCYVCAKLIANAGIIRVVAVKDYHVGKKTKKLFTDANITFDLVNSEVEIYPTK